MRKTITIMICLLMLSIFGTAMAGVSDFYVDPSIADTNSSSIVPDSTAGGVSTYATIADINAMTGVGAPLRPGDTVHINDAYTFREQLTVPISGTLGNPLTFASYGSGASGPFLQRSIDFGAFSTGATSAVNSNGSFETFTGTEDDGNPDTITGWDDGHIVTVADANLTSIPDGTKALLLWDDGTNDSCRNLNIPVAANQYYVLSLWGISDGTGIVRLAARQESSPDDYLIVSLPGSNYKWFELWQSSIVYTPIIAATDTSWTRKYILIKTPKDYSGNIYLKFENTENNSKAYLDNVQLYIPKWNHVGGTTYKIICGAMEEQGGVHWLNGATWTTLTSGTTSGLASNEYATDPEGENSEYLFVNIGKDPDGETVEVGAGNHGVYVDDKSHIIVDGITSRFNILDGFHIDGTGSGITLQNCTAEYNDNDGINGQDTQIAIYVSRCIAQYNGDNTTGGAAGDGLSHHDNCTGIIEDSQFIGNHKSGMYFIQDTATVTKRCLFEDNKNGYILGATCTGAHSLTDSIIISDASVDDGVGIDGGTGNLYNLTLYGALAGNGLKVDGGIANFVDSIISNYDVGMTTTGGVVNNTYNCLYGNSTQYAGGLVAGTGSIATDPRLLNPSGDDVHLKRQSPCINAGTNDRDGDSVDDTGYDDYRGRRRPKDVVSDMGAYEAWKNSPVSPRARGRGRGGRMSTEYSE